MITKFKAITYKDFLKDLDASDENKLPKMIDEYVEAYKQHLLGMYDGDTYRDGDEDGTESIIMTESPVERMFYVALKHEAFMNGFSLTDEYNSFSPQEEFVLEKKKYRVDFCLTAVRSAGKRVVIFIEVDGHKFHNDSKLKVEQDRKRERTLRGICDEMIVFTASEVYKDPEDCARETIRTFKKMLMKKGMSLR